MITVERQKKLNIQFSLDPFMLFVLASLIIHGLGLLMFILSQRSLPAAQQETESTPIDFVVVPPEESLEEPPPDTQRRAENNSLAKGKVEPELPAAADSRITENALSKPEPTQVTPPEIPDNSATAVAPPTPTPPKVEPSPQLEAQPLVEPSPPVTPTPSIPKTPKTAIAPPPSTPPVTEKREPIEQSSPVTPTPSIPKAPKTAISPSNATPEETKLTPPITEKPEPIEKTPLLSESGSTSIPVPQPTPPPKEAPTPETETATPQTELPPVATNSTNLPPKQPVESSTSSRETPPNTENTSVPESTPNPSSEQKTPVGSGTASLLGGTQSRSLTDDAGDSFFNPQANASQQALNPSGVDAQQDLDLGPYFAEVKRRVKRNWQPSTPSDNRQTILAFSIQRNGQITGLRIRQSSGSSKVDQESLEAVQKSAPFAALPANFPNEQLDVEFNFNIYVHQGQFTPDLESWQRF